MKYLLFGLALGALAIPYQDIIALFGIFYTGKFFYSRLNEKAKYRRYLDKIVNGGY